MPDRVRGEVTLRLGGAGDASALAAIEHASDEPFDGLLDFTDVAEGTPRGEALRLPGFVLVAELRGRPVGFAQVRDLGGCWHLEQLSVHPRVQRRGLGTMLLEAAAELAAARGARSLTLITFAEVPWNAPFYAAHGFAVEDDPPPQVKALLDTERRLGLSAVGPRVAIRRDLEDRRLPRPAVSVIPLRDGPAGLEVFVQHRATTMDFAAGAVVFPGGRVDPVDHEHPLPYPDEQLAEHVAAWAEVPLVTASGVARRTARVLLAAAVREVAEETGVVLDPERLLPWDNWITPPGYPRRFDVAFFVVDGTGLAFTNLTTEAVRAGWDPVARLLDDADEGRIALMPPTRTILAELAGIATTAGVLARRPVIEAVFDDRPQPRPRPSRGPAGLPHRAARPECPTQTTPSRESRPHSGR